MFVNNISEIKNPKVGIYYENNIPYMSFESDFNCENDEIIKLKIGKIDLSKLILEHKKITNEYKNCFVSHLPIIEKRIAKITFDILPEDTVLYTLIDITSYKEMKLGDIEKELGYKIKIVD